MKYDGIELDTMTRYRWDGKTRPMLVWNWSADTPETGLVIGWHLNLYGSVVWHTVDGRTWHFCAEFPVKMHQQGTSKEP